MSPSPDQSTPSSQSASSKPAQPDGLITPATASQSVPSKAAADDSEVNGSGAVSNAPDPLVPKRPLMRPVSRPVPPPAQKPNPPAAIATTPIPTTSPTTPPTAVEEADSGPRHQPISPPSEPKQYRAIGLLRGRYVPSEEQFTRGQMLLGDGTVLEAVLLGRIMSLVKNYLDLEKEHLWVVYPRTREMQNNLHAQIVGVWEPEKLRKPEDPEGAAIEEPTAPPLDTSPGYEDDYFSIRGEVLFYAPDRGNLVVRIQQAPRKGADKGKAFKLLLNGTLASERTVGYFWDLQVKRQSNVLVVEGGTAIGLIPPRKRDKDGERSARRPPRRGEGRGASVNRGPRSSGTPPVVRREALPKPAKRTEQGSD